MVNGRMSSQIQWKCQYEEALIQPVREVIRYPYGKLCFWWTLKYERYRIALMEVIF